MEPTRSSSQISVWSAFAYVYPFGLIPKAPGTWGSLVGLAFVWGLHSWAGNDQSLGFTMQSGFVFPWWGMLVMATALAWWIIRKTEEQTEQHDDQRIVIDEVVGQMWAFALVVPQGWNLLAGFALFRLFDITKPGPIGWADRRIPGASGTLLDDVFAGWVTAVILFVANYSL